MKTKTHLIVYALLTGLTSTAFASSAIKGSPASSPTVTKMNYFVCEYRMGSGEAGKVIQVRRKENGSYVIQSHTKQYSFQRKYDELRKQSWPDAMATSAAMYVATHKPQLDATDMGLDDCGPLERCTFNGLNSRELLSCTGHRKNGATVIFQITNRGYVGHVWHSECKIKQHGSITSSNVSFVKSFNPLSDCRADVKP